MIVRCCWSVLVVAACGGAVAEPPPSNVTRREQHVAPSHDELFRRLLASTIELPTAGCDVASPLGDAVDVAVTGLRATGPTTATTTCRAQGAGWRCRLDLETRREPTCDRVPKIERCGITTLTYTYEVELDASWQIAPDSVRCSSGQR